MINLFTLLPLKQMQKIYEDDKWLSLGTELVDLIKPGTYEMYSEYDELVIKGSGKPFEITGQSEDKKSYIIKLSSGVKIKILSSGLQSITKEHVHYIHNMIGVEKRQC